MSKTCIPPERILAPRAIFVACTCILCARASLSAVEYIAPAPVRTIEQLVPPVTMSAHFEAPPTTEPIQSSGTSFYDHGNPTPLEQMMLDRVNRARSAPGAEADRLGIDLNENLAPGTITDTPKQPLAMHPLIINAARDHSAWMLDANVFSHTGEGDSAIYDRITAAGYIFSGFATWSENIAWGGSTASINPVHYTQTRHDGLFISPGHRLNLMNNNFNEIGIGILQGIFTVTNEYGETDYNALMVTQNFAVSDASPSHFVLGTAYYDFNGNDLYDPGEEIGGVQVTIENGDWHTATAGAGGFALPLPSTTGNLALTFTLPELATETAVAHLGSSNLQHDLVLDYPSPLPIGPPLGIIGQQQDYAATPVPGATAYRFTREARLPAPADNPTDLTRMSVSTTGIYTPLSSSIFHTGSAAYHLAHPDGISSETLTYRNAFRPGTNAVIQFYSRLRYATSNQIASVDVSTDGGNAWTAIYEQAGSNASGENTFHQRSLSLSAYADQEIQLRFRYRFAGGSYYSGTGDNLGWFIDSISFTDIIASNLIETEMALPGESYTWIATTNTYWLRVQPLHHANEWPAGSAQAVHPVPPSTYAAWATTHETDAALAPGTLSNDPTGDYSGDGLPNLLAYALDLDPLTELAAAQRPQLVLAGTWIQYDYWHDYRTTDLLFQIELSEDLNTWYTPSDIESPIPALDQHLYYDQHREYRRIKIAPNDAQRVFIRLKVSTQ